MCAILVGAMGANWDQLTSAREGVSFVGPTILDPATGKDEAKLEDLIETGHVRHVSDDYEEQQREFYAIMHPDRVYTPGFDAEFRAYYASLGDISRHGRWVYFPWRSLISHIL